MDWLYIVALLVISRLSQSLLTQQHTCRSAYLSWWPLPIDIPPPHLVQKVEISNIDFPCGGHKFTEHKFHLQAQTGNCLSWQLLSVGLSAAGTLLGDINKGLRSWCRQAYSVYGNMLHCGPIVCFSLPLLDFRGPLTKNTIYPFGWLSSAVSVQALIVAVDYWEIHFLWLSVRWTRLQVSSALPSPLF